MIHGINHINLSVSDIDASFAFYHQLIGLRPLCKWPQGAYFLAGNDWFCLNFTDNKTVFMRQDYTHYGFSVTAEDFAVMKERLIKAGIKPYKDNRSEGESFYFLDPDGHLLELHVGSWQSRLAAKKLKPWPGAEFFV